jgi:hypothetical protein
VERSWWWQLQNLCKKPVKKLMKNTIKEASDRKRFRRLSVCCGVEFHKGGLRGVEAASYSLS